MINDDWWKTYFSREYYRMMILRNKEASQQVKFILNNIDISKNMDILDMCCGYGRHSFEFSNFGHTVLGIDYSQVLINLAKEKLKNNKIKNIDFAVEDIRYFNTLKKYKIVSKGRIKTDYDNTFIDRDFYMSLSKDEYSKIKTTINYYDNNATNIVGSLTVSLNGKEYFKENIYVKEPKKENELKWYQKLIKMLFKKEYYD